MEVKAHWLSSARRCISPNQDLRPISPEKIDLLVLHSICLPPGELDSHWVHSFFLNDLDAEAHPYFAQIANLRVSAHLLIDRLGKITQFVAFDRRAWHAGESCFEGRKKCNDFSIGIEMIGDDNLPFTDSQYSSLSLAVQALIDAYPQITPKRIVGHNEISPGRKTDPAAFDWARFRKTWVVR